MPSSCVFPSTVTRSQERSVSRIASWWWREAAALASGEGGGDADDAASGAAVPDPPATEPGCTGPAGAVAAAVACGAVATAFSDVPCAYVHHSKPTNPTRIAATRTETIAQGETPGRSSSTLPTDDTAAAAAACRSGGTVRLKRSTAS